MEKEQVIKDFTERCRVSEKAAEQFISAFEEKEGSLSEEDLFSFLDECGSSVAVHTGCKQNYLTSDFEDNDFAGLFSPSASDNISSMSVYLGYYDFSENGKYAKLAEDFLSLIPDASDPEATKNAVEVMRGAAGRCVLDKAQDIEAYRENFEDKTPYYANNHGYLMQVAGVQNDIAVMIAENGNAEDMRDFLYDAKNFWDSWTDSVSTSFLEFDISEDLAESAFSSLKEALREGKPVDVHRENVLNMLSCLDNANLDSSFLLLPEDVSLTDRAIGTFYLSSDCADKFYAYLSVADEVNKSVISEEKRKNLKELAVSVISEAPDMDYAQLKDYACAAFSNDWNQDVRFVSERYEVSAPEAQYLISLAAKDSEHYSGIEEAFSALDAYSEREDDFEWEDEEPEWEDDVDALIAEAEAECESEKKEPSEKRAQEVPSLD